MHTATAHQSRYDTFRSTKHFSALDGLRAISVIAVIWQHTAGYNQSGGLLSRGYLGVDCFFAISGFLITTLLLREHQAAGRISLRQFYLRRSARIFPIYFVVLAAYVVLMFARRHTADGIEFFHNLPAFATYTSNWFAAGGDKATFYFAWSLATEEQFYLFWPPLLVLLAVRRWLAPVAVLLALVAVDQLATAGGVRILASLATPILLGAVVAVLLHHRSTYRVAARVLAGPLAAPTAVLTTLAALQYGVPDVAGEALLVLVVATLVVREDTVVHPVLTWRPLAWVGTISYGIYLMHMLVANLVRPVIGERLGIAVFALTVPVVIGVAGVSFRWFETPVREAVRRRPV